MFTSFHRAACACLLTTKSNAKRLLFFCCVLTTLQADARDQGISLSFKDAHITDVFREITRQTGTMFLYTEQLLEGSPPVSVHVSNVPLDLALDKCLANQPLEWSMVNGTIVISRKKSSAIQNEDTSRVVNGVVRSAAGLLEGASVIIKNTLKGTTTDKEGRFTLRLGRNDRTLIISSVGHDQMEFTIPARGVVDITLRIASSKLDEAVVIAYGSTSRRINTGNVGKVSEAEIEQQPVSNPLAAMQGRIPGVLIQQSTGMPGGAFKVQIRGRNSLRSSGNQPLFLVDGIPYPPAAVSSSFTSDVIKGGSPLNFINPADIQSIEVLKDADATAIYGSRGANGIVLITTKKPNASRAGLRLDISHGLGKVASKLNLLDRRNYLDMRYEAFANDGIDVNNADVYAPDLKMWDTTRNTDWQNTIIGRTAHFSRANVQFSGGSEFTQFLLSTSYLRETTVMPMNFSDDKKSLHLSVDHTLKNRRLRLSATATYMADVNNLPVADVTELVYRLVPVAPAPLTADGKINWENGTHTDNPYQYLLRRYDARSQNLMGNLSVSYEIIRGLKAVMSAGFNRIDNDEKTIAPYSTVYPVIYGGNTTFSFGQQQSYIAEPQLEFRRALFGGNVNILLGSTIQQMKRKSHALLGYGYTSDALQENMLAAPGHFLLENKNVLYRYQAFFGRLNYEYKKRYLLNVTARRDGSSRFGPGKQFANFGAVGAGWIFSEEKFVENFRPLSFGKLRASAGTTGSDQINDYGFLDLWSSTGTTYGGLLSIYPNNLYNPDLGWETNKKLEAAIELGFFKDRLLLTLSKYRNRTSDQLVGLPLSAVTGFTSIPFNLGAVVENAGWEAETAIELFDRPAFRWNVTFNFSSNRNKLVSYPDLEGSLYAESYIEGQPLTVRRTFISKGIDPSTGLYQFEDVNKDGEFTLMEDGIALVNPAPLGFGGFGTSVSFGGLDISLIVQFVKQKAFNYSSLFFPAGVMLNQPELVMNRWTPVNTNAVYQKFSTSAAAETFNLYSQSNAAVEDASYARLKNISVTYDLKKIVRHSKLSSLKVYLRAQNLFTVTRYSGLDPETLDLISLPPLKIVSFGIDVTL